MLGNILFVWALGLLLSEIKASDPASVEGPVSALAPENPLPPYSFLGKISQDNPEVTIHDPERMTETDWQELAKTPYFYQLTLKKYQGRKNHRQLNHLRDHRVQFCNLTECTFNSDDVATIASWKGMVSLKLSDVRFMDGEPHDLRPLATLHVLGLFHVPAARSILKIAADWPELTQIGFGDIGLTRDDEPLLNQLKACRSLSLSSPVHRNGPILGWCPPTKEDLLSIEVAIGTMPNITSLYLTGPAVTDESLKGLARLPWLSRLRINQAAITDNCMESIGQCTKLSELDLSECPIRGTKLRELKSQEFLSLGLRKLPLDDTALENFSRGVSVNGLSLDHTEITDAALKPLREVRGLNSLYVAHTKVTVEGAAGFVLDRPGVLVTTVVNGKDYTLQYDYFKKYGKWGGRIGPGGRMKVQGK